MSSLEERWRIILEKKSEAAKKSGRSDSEITLVAVSKFHSAEMIRELHNLGQKDFGENYLQEVKEKQAILSDPSIVWHMIGHLQNNKAKSAVGCFALIHTLDSLRTAKILAGYCETELPLTALVQVNIGEEEQKSGIKPNDLNKFFETIMLDETVKKSKIKISGLMCIPPVCVIEKRRQYFSKLRNLKDEVEKEFNVTLPELSMGMSDDFEQAIEEGATLIRVGTAIFGERPKK